MRLSGQSRNGRSKAVRSRCFIPIALAATGACASSPVQHEPSLIEVVELRTSGNSIPQPASRSIQGVDINSTLQLRIKVPAAPHDNTSRLDSRLVRDYERLTFLLETLSRILELNVATEQSYRATHNADGQLVASVEHARLIDFYRKQRAEAIQQAIRTTRGYVADQLGRTIGPDTLRDIGIARALDSLGIRVSDFGGAYATYLHSELRRVDSAMRSQAGALARGAQPVTVRAHAQIIRQDGTRERIHLPGYDTLDAGVPSYVNKLSINLSEPQQEQLRRSFELHANLARAASELRRNGFTVDSLLQNFTAGLTTLFTALPPDTINAIVVRQIGELRAKLDENHAALRTLAPALEPQISRIVARLDSARAVLEQAASSIRALHALARTDSKASTNIIIDLPQTILADGVMAADELRALLFPADGPSIVTLLASIGDSARAAIGQVKPVTPGDSLLIVMLTRTIDEFVTRVRPVIDNGYPQLRGILIEALALTDPNLVRFAVGTPNTSDVLNVPVASAGPTELQLLRTARSEGDLISVSVELRDSSGRLEEQNRLFRVLRYGAHTNVGANLVFAFPNRENNDDPVFAPAVAYTLRYRMRENTAGAGLYNFLMPGLTLNLAQLDFGEEEIELGAAVGLSLLSGVIEGGFGYNFGSDLGYSYVAIGVLDALRQLRRPF